MIEWTAGTQVQIIEIKTIMFAMLSEKFAWMWLVYCLFSKSRKDLVIAKENCSLTRIECVQLALHLSYNAVGFVRINGSRVWLLEFTSKSQSRKQNKVFVIISWHGRGVVIHVIFDYVRTAARIAVSAKANNTKISSIFHFVSVERKFFLNLINLTLSTTQN